MLFIVNDTSLLTRQETHAHRESVSSVTAAVILPDGTTLSPAPAVTSQIGGPDIAHLFTFVLHPTQAGPYRVTWTLSLSDGQTLDRVETHFACWTDVGALVRRRMQETPATLTDADLAPEVAFTVRTLVDRFVPLRLAGGYSGLTGLDQDRFDTAAALLTAVGLRPSRPKQTPVGEVGSVTLEQQEFRFSTGPPGPSLESQWREEALLALGRVTVIQAAYASAAASFQPFTVSGPTRFARTQGEIETLLGGVIRLLTDQGGLSASGEAFRDPGTA